MPAIVSRKIRALVDRFPARQLQPIPIPVMATSRNYEPATVEPRHLLPWTDPYIASLHRQLERDAGHDRRSNRSPSRHPGKHASLRRAQG
jgi:hypothetical protein